MEVFETAIRDVKIFEPRVFEDDRGFFFESFNEERFLQHVSLEKRFVQDNHSKSEKGVLRGLHYQVENVQGKLVRVIQGEVLDVAVDLRQSSPSFGQWVSVYLSADNRRQIWVPEGFAHGFLVLSESAEFAYKATDYYNPQAERCIAWNDCSLAIDWGIKSPIVSAKDELGSQFPEAEYFA